MDLRRRRNHGAESHGDAAEQRGGAERPAAEQRGGAERPAADGAERPAAGGAERPAAGDSGEMVAKVEETAIIGHELVPVGGVVEVEKPSEEQLQLKVVPEGFKTPEMQRPARSPGQLQLENKTDLKTNEDSEGKGEKEEKGQVVAVPNGPPVSYGLQSAVSIPLFTPEQIAQVNDPRNSTSLLPMTRESVMAPEFPRLPAFLHGLLPWYEHLHEVRQRDLQWRSQMERLSNLVFNCAHSKMRIFV